ncbi:hypothetical protein [Aeoliella sp.]|uniref:hypothetical protein n=1 Tax=Aeoliella sp. TaxID=2795800 RepID=UPI003CCBBC98
MRHILLLAIALLLTGCSTFSPCSHSGYVADTTSTASIVFVSQPCVPHVCEYLVEDFDEVDDVLQCKLVPETKTSTYTTVRNAEHFGDVIAASAVPGIQGVNAVKLLEVLTTALEKCGYTVERSGIYKDEVAVTTAVEPISGQDYVHRVIARISSATAPNVEDRISIQVYSQPMDGSRAPKVVPRDLFKELKSNLIGQETDDG